MELGKIDHKLLLTGLLAIVALVGMTVFISQSNVTGAQTIIMPGVDDLLTQQKGMPMISAKMSTEGRGLKLGSRAAQICGEQSGSMGKCCRQTCPSLCGTFDKACRDACIGICNPAALKAQLAR